MTEIRDYDVRNHGVPDMPISMDIAGVTVRMRFRWMPRVRRWWWEITDPDGSIIAQPGLVASGGRAIWDTEDPRVPSGSLLWTGPDPYDRDDLGTALRMLFVPAPAPPRRLGWREIIAARTPPGVDWSSTTVTWDSTLIDFSRSQG